MVDDCEGGLVGIPNISFVELNEVLILDAGHHEIDTDFRHIFLYVMRGHTRILLFGKTKEILLFCLSVVSL